MINSNYLPFLLKHEVVATYQDRTVYILDRRVFPRRVDYISCQTVYEVADAIKSMVTQGGGPLEAALWAMVMAEEDKQDLEEAKEILISSRPTNRTMAYELDRLLSLYKGNLKKGVEEILSLYDENYLKMADYGESLIEDGDGILTTCFPEHSFILSVLKAINNGKDVTIYVPETRPYLQGARLTRPSLEEMGINVVLLTDNLVGTYFSNNKISKYMTASDVAFKDKTIVNKIGTLQNAIVSSYYNVPYYAFSLALEEKRRIEDVKIETRDSYELNYFDGRQISTSYVGPKYPIFDIIPPKLVTSIITPKGIIN